MNVHWNDEPWHISALSLGGVVSVSCIVFKTLFTIHLEIGLRSVVFGTSSIPSYKADRTKKEDNTRCTQLVIRAQVKTGLHVLWSHHTALGLCCTSRPIHGRRSVSLLCTVASCVITRTSSVDPFEANSASIDVPCSSATIKGSSPVQSNRT